jgi:hypothetical protein
MADVVQASNASIRIYMHCLDLLWYSSNCEWRFVVRRQPEWQSEIGVLFLGRGLRHCTSTVLYLFLATIGI